MLLEDRSMADGRYTASSASESAVEHATAGREPRKSFDLQEVGVRGGLAFLSPSKGRPCHFQGFNALYCKPSERGRVGAVSLPNFAE
jgi:hypothetical protein